jgi:CPA2 family monovalent cation:H+ antiporter-2
MNELDQHVRAGAELIVEVLTRQTTETDERLPLSDVKALLPELDATPIVLSAGSPAVGKSLAELDLRAKRGASVLAIIRGDGGAADPSPHELLRESEVLALTGSDDALVAARAILLVPC